MIGCAQRVKKERNNTMHCWCNKKKNNEQELNRTLNNANRHVIFYWARLIRCRSQCVVTYTYVFFFDSFFLHVYVIWTCCWPWFKILSIVCAHNNAYYIEDTQTYTHNHNEDNFYAIYRVAEDPLSMYGNTILIKNWLNIAIR